MKTVLTFGVYDMLHIGHINLFKRAKELGDRLIVAVQVGETVQKYKPTAEVQYTTEERIFMVESIKYVDEVIVYEDVDKDIKNISFDIFAKGPDQIHDGFMRAVEWCNKNGKDVIELPRTDGVSSTLLRFNFKKNQ